MPADWKTIVVGPLGFLIVQFLRVLFSVIIGVLVSLLLVRWSMHAARAHSVLARPGHRMSHTVPTPRLGGLGMAVFIAVHILASFIGGETGGFLNGMYENWAFQIFIFFCALFHAINGLRITVLDLWPNLQDYQTEAIWIEWAVFIPLFGISAFVIMNTALGG